MWSTDDPVARRVCLEIESNESFTRNITATRCEFTVATPVHHDNVSMMYDTSIVLVAMTTLLTKSTSSGFSIDQATI